MNMREIEPRALRQEKGKSNPSSPYVLGHYTLMDVDDLRDSKVH